MEGLSPEQFEISQVNALIGYSLIEILTCLFIIYPINPTHTRLWFVLRLAQFKEFLTTYNNVTENCFKECVHDFTSRRVTKQEAS